MLSRLKKTYKKIILATEKNNEIKLNLGLELENMINELYNMVEPVKYIRVYSYHKEPHGLECSYRTKNLPGKVIVINKNILMCCYTEDYQAIKLFELLDKNEKQNQIEIIYRLLTNSNIKITKPDDIIIKFWNSGVHYNKPSYDCSKKIKILKKLMDNNIILVGEAVSNSHGWVCSALESVEAINDIKN